jgi:hypothetical protein
MTEELRIIEKPELQSKSTSIINKANKLTIKTNEDDAMAIDFVKTIKAMRKEITDELEPNKNRAYKLFKGLKAQMDKFTEPLDFAERIIKNKSIAYRQEIERKIMQEEEKKVEAARKEEDRKRREIEDRARKAEAEAEVQRRAKEKAEAEAQKAEGLMRSAEDDAKNAKNAEEKALAEKAEQEAKALIEKARNDAIKAEFLAQKKEAKNKELLQKASTVYVNVKPVTTTKSDVKGSTISDHWEVGEVDIDILPEEYFKKIVNMELLNGIAKSTKGKKHIPGVTFVNKKNMSIKLS